MDEYELEDGFLAEISSYLNRYYLLHGTLLGLAALVLNRSIATLLSSNQLRLEQTARYVQANWVFFVGCALLFGVAYRCFADSLYFDSFLGSIVSFRFRAVVAMLGVVVACLFEKLAGKPLFGANEYKLLLFLAFFLIDRVLMTPIFSSALDWLAENTFAIAVVMAILFFFFWI
ncbi:MAG: hypothetical protein QM441_04090 [Synergistota bacterium]|jgi:hypothetical protein|nr:hypothetical protein [Synergistota bacterium]